MKKTQIIGIAFIAVLLGALTATLSDSGKQADFKEAFINAGDEYRVVGYLDESVPIHYDPVEDPSLTTFRMRDESGTVKEVLLKKSKPQGLEQSESLVLIGHAKGDKFIATDMQMKCPSKYNQDNHMMQAIGEVEN